MWEATTPSAETFSGLVPCSLFRLLTQAMCIPLQRKKEKRVKKSCLAPPSLMKHLQVQGEGGCPQQGGLCLESLLFHRIEEPEFFLFQQVEERGICPDLLVSTWLCILRSWLSAGKSLLYFRFWWLEEAGTLFCF